MYVAKEVPLRSERRVVTLENHLKNIALVGVSSKFTHPVTQKFERFIETSQDGRRVGGSAGNVVARVVRVDDG